MKEPDMFIHGLLPGSSRLGLSGFHLAKTTDCFNVLAMLNMGNAAIREQISKETWRRFVDVESEDPSPPSSPTDHCL